MSNVLFNGTVWDGSAAAASTGRVNQPDPLQSGPDIGAPGRVHRVLQETALDSVIVVRDALGNPITDYDGSQSLITTYWPGGDRQAAFQVLSNWVHPGEAKYNLFLDPGVTRELSPGRYQLSTTLTDAGVPVECYSASLDIMPAAGTALAPKVYTTYNDLLNYGRSWVKALQTEDDQAGFAEEQARARSWIENVAHAHHRGAGRGARGAWLQARLDAGRLVVTDEVREACAKKALAFLCEGQVARDGANPYAKLARMYHSQAEALLIEGVGALSIDADGDGVPDLTIDVSRADCLWG